MSQGTGEEQVLATFASIVRASGRASGSSTASAHAIDVEAHGVTASANAVIVESEGVPAAPADVRVEPARTPTILAVIEALVPQRIANEQIGDALEVIEKFRRDGRPRWFAWLKIASTAVWLVVHSLAYAVRQFRQKDGNDKNTTA